MVVFPLCSLRLPTFHGGLLLLALTVVGCGPDKMAIVPVGGKVKVNGKPAFGATVIFHPVDQFDKECPTPAGRVDDSGSYQLTSYEAFDGAPVGEYDVTIVWSEPRVKDRLKGRYRDPKTSGLRAKVTEDNDVVPDFELQVAGQIVPPEPKSP